MFKDFFDFLALVDIMAGGEDPFLQSLWGIFM